MMKLTVWGGAGEHGRSAYLLSGNRVHLLLDCGVMKEGTGVYPIIQPEQVPQLNAVFLSHAHEDHSVAIPLLYRLGYQGEVWTTRETAAQLTAYFASWREYTERVGEKLPYREEDQRAIRYRFLEEEAKRLTWFDALPGVKVMWGRSGHLMGSVWLLVEAEGKRIFYSGDYTSESLLLEDDNPTLADTSSAMLLDLAIVDAAYGTDAHSQADRLRQLEQTIQSTLQSGGKVLLPVPAVGRGQEMILWASRNWGHIPIVTEAPLIEGMKRLLCRSEWLRSTDSGQGMKSELELLLSQNNWIVPGSDAERESWLEKQGASLWFVTDGMMQSDLAQWYYHRFSRDSRNLVLLTGHVSNGTFGQRLLQHPEDYGDCSVMKIRYKVHQGLADVRQMITAIPAQHTVLVHADKAETDRLRVRLVEELTDPHIHIHSISVGEEVHF
ncbi:Zn-dependent hydrolase [Paenibacillus vortex V453]|uniref:Zn-dependent hydrolase n=1 Tax=Paenibacillus vortex V453 TaxID=715225 RepID=A0A2R9SZ03_9BACL|nr:MBL fold metallo-hydrolase [Paenibacillus vortex]EFU42557.1 Zn-dependent hydrolase [Paenibacillus vortex V453]